MSDLARATELMSYWTQLTPGEAARAVAEVLERERKGAQAKVIGEIIDKCRRYARAQEGIVRPVTEVLNELADELERCHG